MPIGLAELLKKIPEDTGERVDRIRKRYNPIIRELLRKETGLLLNRQDKDNSSPELVSVPVKLVAGLPEPLRNVVLDEDAGLISILSRNR